MEQKEQKKAGKMRKIALYIAIFAVFSTFLLNISFAATDYSNYTTSQLTNGAIGLFFTNLLSSTFGGSTWWFAFFFVMVIMIIMGLFRLNTVIALFIFTITIMSLIVLGALPFVSLALPMVIISALIAFGVLKYLATIWFGG